MCIYVYMVVKLYNTKMNKIEKIVHNFRKFNRLIQFLKLNKSTHFAP